MPIGKPSENRFNVGEIRFSNPKDPCTISMIKVVGSANSVADERIQPRLSANERSEKSLMASPIGQLLKLFNKMVTNSKWPLRVKNQHTESKDYL